MTDNPKFSPQRSAAIRQLLIENVEAEPRRRSRHLRALLAGLVITGVVASGSTALALNRDALFSAPPSATESPTSTPVRTQTPDANPAPTPVAPEADPISVGKSPIAPRDVVSTPAGAGWSLPLPGLGEAGRLPAVQNISEGYALISVGPEHSPQASTDPATPTQTGFSLTLIDTAGGTAIWSREWNWSVSAGHDSSFATAIPLGTSGRILVQNDGDTAGPHEVLELTTGATIAAFDPTADNEILQHVTPVHGASGDVLATFGVMDADGGPLPYSFVRRFSPGQSTSPIWSTRIEGTNPIVVEALNEIGYTKLFYFPPGANTGVAGVLDLATGAYSPRESGFDYNFFTGYTVRVNSTDGEGYSSTLTGLDDNGDEIWTGADDHVRGVSEVLTSAYQPGASSFMRIGTGQFIRATDGQFSLVDGLTGNTLWSRSASDWGIEYSSVPLSVSTDGEALLACAFGGETVCLRVDPLTGDNLGAAPWIYNALHGEHVDYSLSEGILTATDIESGSTLWSIGSSADSLFFAGGYLVTTEGDSIRSIG